MTVCELEEIFKKVDARHFRAVDNSLGGILRAIRSMRADIVALPSAGPGFFLVGYRQSNYVLLIKPEGEPLTPEERQWIKDYNGCCEVVRSVSDARGAIEQSYRERMAELDE